MISSAMRVSTRIVVSQLNSKNKTGIRAAALDEISQECNVYHGFQLDEFDVGTHITRAHIFSYTHTS